MVGMIIPKWPKFPARLHCWIVVDSDGHGLRFCRGCSMFNWSFGAVSYGPPVLSRTRGRPVQALQAVQVPGWDVRDGTWLEMTVFFSDWVGRGQVLDNYYDARSWMKQKLNLNGSHWSERPTWRIASSYCGWKKSCSTLDGWNPIVG